MKAGGRGGDGAFVSGENGLVALAVEGFFVALHVVGEGEVAVAVFVDGTVPGNQAVAIFEDFLNGTHGVA